jgi:hypothetical protein
VSVREPHTPEVQFPRRPLSASWANSTLSPRLVGYTPRCPTGPYLPIILVGVLFGEEVAGRIGPGRSGFRKGWLCYDTSITGPVFTVSTREASIKAGGLGYGTTTPASFLALSGARMAQAGRRGVPSVYERTAARPANLSTRTAKPKNRPASTRLVKATERREAAVSRAWSRSVG